MEITPQFLHVGCGSKRKPETPFAKTNWKEIRFDINPAAQPDVTGSMTEMHSVKDASMDAIYSSHNIEHLYPHEVSIALKEFKRVLKPDGFALITCPDLQSICEIVAKDKLLDPLFPTPLGAIAAIDIIFGYRPAIQRGETHMAHRCGFTATSMVKTLTAAGFTSLAARARGNFNLWVIAGINQEKSWLINKAHTFFPTEHKNKFNTKPNESA